VLPILGLANTASGWWIGLEEVGAGAPGGESMQPETLTFHTAHNPEKPAIIMGLSGTALTFAALDAASNRASRVFRDLGLAPGDRVAMCLPNCLEHFSIAWGVLRSRLILIPISNKLTADEVAFILKDAGAKLLITSADIGAVSEKLPTIVRDVTLFAVGTAGAGFRSWTAECAEQSPDPIDDKGEGGEMLYSSGTTGRPKGVSYTTAATAGGLGVTLLPLAKRLGFNADTIYLSPAPLYHAAPYGFTMATLRLGGTVVVLEQFDAEQSLALIQKYRVTISQWVPTHFVRMLKLPDEVRCAYDLSSMNLALHAAAPCPVPTKRSMIDWWGKILFEYYGSSEQSALTLITSDEWLAHPGSVGRCVRGKLHICDEGGDPLPAGAVGEIYSEGGLEFSYNNESEKTRRSRNSRGWTTVGDIGYLDSEGYLYLTDRKHFMIISGGVNIYPQEIEDLLVMHPKVSDAAVIGTPHDDLGEQVTAVIQPLTPADATEEFAEELRRWLRERLSGVKIPKRIEFLAELPRLPTGKMVKGALRKMFERVPKAPAE
jgi:long-chain acyl-CoA synthetase